VQPFLAPSRPRRRRPHLRRIVAGAATLALAASGLAVALATPASADVVPQGSGGYLTSPPGATPGMGCNTDSRTYLTNDVPAGTAVPTNDWWSSLVFRNSQGGYASCDSVMPLYAHPAAYQPTTEGMTVSYPTVLQLSQYEYHYPHTPDFTVGVAGLSTASVKVAGWTDWTVTSSQSDGTRTLRSTIGHGLPFSWYEATGGDATISLADGTTAWLENGGTLGLSVRGRSFALFAPHGTTWAKSGTTYSAPAGRFSVVALPDVPETDRAGVVAQYAPYAYSPVTDTHVSYAYDDATAKVTATYHVTATPWAGSGSSETGAVVALYPHQAAVLSGTTLSGLTYTSPRGTMPVVVGGHGFTTVDTFHGVLPEIPAVATSSGTARTTLENYLDQVAADPLDQRGDDTYWTGKSLGRASRIVEISDQLGRTGQRDSALSAIRDQLTDWLTATEGKTAHVFAYDSQWQTLIGYPASYGSETELNDHHFHYGYFIAAAATLARFDPAWAQQYGPMVDTLIRDANNYDRTDTRFPYLRDFDVYAGHDWASGDAPFGAGNNQESSSEGMNFDGAVIEWGEATGNREVRDAGIFMYTTQAEAINRYWFNSGGATFPTGYAFDSVGMVWGNGGAYATWFSGDPEMITGINTLPITGSHLYLGDDPATVQRVYGFMEQRNGGAPTVWQDILWEYLALGDPDAALAKLENDSGFSSEEGESKAHTYHWIRNLAALGNVDTSVTADSPLAAVFVKDGHRTYSATNASSVTKTVRFSDGTTLSVPAGRTATTGAFSWVGGGATGGDPVGPGDGGPGDGTGDDDECTATAPGAASGAVPTAATTTPLGTFNLTADGTLSATAGAAGTITLASAAGGSHIDEPHDPSTFVATGLTSSHLTGATGFSIKLDAGTMAGAAVQARVSYDWTGDGTWDRTETYPYFATDPVVGDETYTSGGATVDGSWADLDGGSVRLELWTVFGAATPTVTVGGASTLTAPFGTTSGDDGSPGGGDDSDDGGNPGDDDGGPGDDDGTTTCPTSTVTASLTAAARKTTYHDHGKVTATVTAAGRSVAGVLTVRKGAKVRAQIAVPARTGSATITALLPRSLKVGRHALSVSFAPAAGTRVAAPRAATVSLKVRKAKPRWGKVTVKKRLRVGTRGALRVVLKPRGAAKPRGAVKLLVGKKVVGRAKVRHRGTTWVAKVRTKRLHRRGKVSVRLAGNKFFTASKHATTVKVKRTRR